MKDEIIKCACNGLPCDGDCQDANLNRGEKGCPAAYIITPKRHTRHDKTNNQEYDWKEVIHQWVTNQ